MAERKAHSLIGQIYDRRNLACAWQQVKRNKGAGGIDGVTIARFEANRDHYLDVLHEQLRTGRYRPRPVRRVEIDKPGSATKRPLGIPTVMDRVCQQALVQVLAPIFEPTFAEASFGYRPGRSAHMAMRRIWSQLQAGGGWIVDADLADFFGSLPHEQLIDRIADRVADGKVLSLIRSMLTAGVLRDGMVERTIAGTPQGGVVTPPTRVPTSVSNRVLAELPANLNCSSSLMLSPLTCRVSTLVTCLGVGLLAVFRARPHSMCSPSVSMQLRICWMWVCRRRMPRGSWPVSSAVRPAGAPLRPAR